MTVGPVFWDGGGQKPVVRWGPKMPEGGGEGSESGGSRLELDVLSNQETHKLGPTNSSNSGTLIELAH